MRLVAPFFASLAVCAALAACEGAPAPNDLSSTPHALSASPDAATEYDSDDRAARREVAALDEECAEGAHVDACGVCEGDGSRCADCAGLPNGEATWDYCGVCGGDAESCLFCATSDTCRYETARTLAVPRRSDGRYRLRLGTCEDAGAGSTDRLRLHVQTWAESPMWKYLQVVELNPAGTSIGARASVAYTFSLRAGEGTLPPSEIAALRLSKRGNDPLCIRSVTLEFDGSVVWRDDLRAADLSDYNGLHRETAAETTPRLWLDAAAGESSVLFADHPTFVDPSQELQRQYALELSTGDFLAGADGAEATGPVEVLLTHDGLIDLVELDLKAIEDRRAGAVDTYLVAPSVHPEGALSLEGNGALVGAQHLNFLDLYPRDASDTWGLAGARVLRLDDPDEPQVAWESPWVDYEVQGSQSVWVATDLLAPGTTRLYPGLPLRRSGGWECGAFSAPWEVPDDTCNGADDDCDGAVDEDATCPPVQADRGGAGSACTRDADCRGALRCVDVQGAASGTRVCLPPAISGECSSSDVDQNPCLDAQRGGAGACGGACGDTPLLPEDATVAIPEDSLVRTEVTPGGPHGGLWGQSEVTTDGAFAYTLPLEVPAGRLGVQPALALSYNSRGPNGALGVGWSLSGGGRIERCGSFYAADGHTRAVRFDRQDHFCLGGERLVVVAGQYGLPGSEYRTERDSYQQILAHGEGGAITHFEVRSHDGTRRFFGSNENARVSGARVEHRGRDGEDVRVRDPDATLAWALREVRDGFGNAVRYRYHKRQRAGDDATHPHAVEHMLREISYTHGHGDAAATRRVVFERERRDDVLVSRTSGFTEVQPWRYAAIRMELTKSPTGGEGPVLAWRYELAYGASPSTGRSRLLAVRQCDDYSCPNSVGFEWEHVPDFAAPEAFTAVDQQLDTGFEWFALQLPYMVADFDGDALKDIVHFVADPDSDYRGSGWTGPTALMRGSRDCAPGTPFCFGEARQVAEGGAFDGPLEGASITNPYDWDADGDYEVVRSGPHDSLIDREDFLPGVAIYDYFAPASFVPVFAEATASTDTAASLVADLDGRGQMDLVHGPGYEDRDETRPVRWIVRRGQPGGGVEAPVEVRAPSGGGTSATAAARVLDLDGDGASEWFHDLGGQSDEHILYRREDGVIVQERNTPNLPSFARGGTSVMLFADVDGDGLQDFLMAGGGDAHDAYRPNTGLGFAAYRPSGIPRSDSTRGIFGPAFWGTSDPLGIRVVDVNGDGIEDFVWPRCAASNCREDDFEIRMEVSDARVGYRDIRVATPTGWTKPEQVSEGWANFTSHDVNGDGAPDILFFNEDHLYLLLNNHPAQEKIAAITDGYHRKQRVEYAPISDPEVHTPGRACAYPQRCVTEGMEVVRRHLVDSGLTLPGGEPWYDELLYHYEDARTDVQGRGFLGFGRREVRDVRRARTTFELYDACRPDDDDAFTRVDIGSPDAPAFAYPFAGMPTRVRVQTEGADRLYETETLHGYEVVQTDAPLYQVEERGLRVNEIEDVAGASETDPCAPRGPIVRATETEFEYDLSGEISRELQLSTALSEPEGGLPGMRESRYGQLTEEVTRYSWSGRGDDREDNDWVRRPRERLTEALAISPEGSGERALRTVAYEHGPSGALLAEILEPEGSHEEFLRTEYVRDARGLVERVETHVKNDSGQTLVDRVTRHGYDDEGVFVTRTQNPMGHVSVQAVHPVVGQPVVAVDENGVRTEWRYDSFGRLRDVIAPDGAHVALTYRWLGGDEGDFAVDEEHADGFRATTFYDRLGRGVRSDETGYGRDGPDPRSTVVTHVVYDLRGNVVGRSRPAYDDEDPEYTVYTYDALDRPHTIEAPGDEVTTFRYDGLKHTVENAEGGLSSFETDGDGRVLRREEHVTERTNQGLREATYVTEYRYSPFGLVREVRQDDTLVFLASYDTRGRPHRVTTADTGMVEYAHDPHGDLMSKIDAEGVTTWYDRDALGRPEGRTVRGLDGRDELYFYEWDRDADGGKDGAIRRTFTSPDSVETIHDYDALARPTRTTWRDGGRLYDVDVHYDDLGRLARVQYPSPRGGGQPSRLQVQYDYTPGSGFLSHVSLRDVWGHDQEVWRAEGREARGFLTRERFGSGVSTTRSFDPTTGRLTHLRTEGAGFGRLQDLRYPDYDRLGNVVRRDDRVAGREDAYEYDELGRLVQWSREGGGSALEVEVEYQYDALGNLQRARSLRGPRPTQTYAYDHTTLLHAPTRDGDRTLRYDGAGRLTAAITDEDGARTDLQYTSFDLPRGITQPERQTRFAYDAFQHRVRKEWSGGADEGRRFYVPELFEERSTASGDLAHVFYVGVGTRTVAQVTFDAQTGVQHLEYLHDDHLGSVVQTSGEASRAAGDVTERPRESLHYSPWGARMGPDGDPQSRPDDARVARGFTGHEHDDALGLVNMKGRLYDPALKHFLTPDPLPVWQLLGANPPADVEGGLQPPGPWPHGKASSSAQARFSAGGADGSGYALPSLSVPGASTTTGPAKALGDTLGGDEAGAVHGRTVAGSHWTNGYDLPGSQELNPYAYVLNNPVRYTDPTGFQSVEESQVGVEDALDVIGDVIYNYFVRDIGQEGGFGYCPACPWSQNKGAGAEGGGNSGTDGRAQSNHSSSEASRDGSPGRSQGGGPAPRGRALPENAGPTGKISPSEVSGKTPSQIDSRARELGLEGRGPDPAQGRGSYVDPQTGKQRILSHPNADPPHGHVNNPAGQRIDSSGRTVPPESPEAHLPIRPE